MLFLEEPGSLEHEGGTVGRQGLDRELRYHRPDIIVFDSLADIVPVSDEPSRRHFRKKNEGICRIEPYMHLLRRHVAGKAVATVARAHNR